MATGLIDNEKIHLDGSHIESNAFIDSLVKADPIRMGQLREVYQVQESKLESALAAQIMVQYQDNLSQRTPFGKCHRLGFS